MKKLFIPVLAVLLFASCKKEYFDNDHLENNQGHPKPDKQKIDVCHKEGNGSSHMINISINAWPAHQAHGDVRLDDQDGDGYVPNNPCGFGKMGDCNDLMATIHPGATEICGNNVDDNCNGQIDENCFASVTICNQVWMLKNMDQGTYRNGDKIPEIKDYNAWATATSGAWCWFNNDSINYAATYGKLYNWYAVNDPRGLAPLGWHVPTSAEWAALANCLGGEAVAGGALKEAGTAHWIAPNTGATNSSGFTALPAGMRVGSTGSFSSLNLEAYWWSSTQLSVANAMVDVVLFNTAILYPGIAPKTYGFSVRCVRD